MRALPVLLLAAIVVAWWRRAPPICWRSTARRRHRTQYAAARATWAAGQEKLPLGRSGLPPVRRRCRQDPAERPRLPRAGPRDPEHDLALQFQRAVAVDHAAPLPPAESHGIRAGKDAGRAGRCRIRARGAGCILRVAQAYFDVLLAQNTVELAGRGSPPSASSWSRPSATSRSAPPRSPTRTMRRRYDLTVSGEIAAKNDPR